MNEQLNASEIGEGNILSVGLGDMFPVDGERVSGALQRQLDYASNLKNYYVITKTSSKEKYQNTKIENLHLYHSNSRNDVAFLFDATRIGYRIAKQERIDLVTAAGPLWCGIVAYFLSRLIKVPFDLNLMSDLVKNASFRKTCPIRSRIIEMAAYWMISRSSSVRVSTNVELRKLYRLFPKKRIYKVPFYVDPDKFEMRERLSTPSASDPKKVLFVGRLGKQKAADKLLEAHKMLTEDFFSRVELLIVGDGPCREKLYQKAKKLGILSRVHFTGKVPYNRVKDFYRQADVFAITSIHEGTCMVLYEAALMEKPIVATRFAGAVDLLSELGEFCLCQHDNISCIAKKIANFLKNRELSLRVGKALHYKVLSISSPEIISKLRADEWRKTIDLSDKG